MHDQHPQIAYAFALCRAGRVRDGVTIIAAVAAQGHPDGLFALGDFYWRGDTVPHDPAMARDLFRRAAALGHPIAALTYTNLLASGTAGSRDWPQALAQLRAEAAAGPHRARTLALVEAMDLTPEGDPRTAPRGETLSHAPEITRFPSLFTPAECNYLIESAEPALGPSMVADGKGGEIRDPIRTSDGATMHALVEDPAIHALNRRLAAASGSRVAQGEPLQTLRYQPGQQYRRHVDWLSDGGNARILTALVYLNQGYQGGETAFGRIGLTVAGRMGDGLVFRNGSHDAVDPLTEHAGLPVTGGVKYLASRWIRAHDHAGGSS